MRSGAQSCIDRHAWPSHCAWQPNDGPRRAGITLYRTSARRDRSRRNREFRFHVPARPSVAGQLIAPLRVV